MNQKTTTQYLMISALMAIGGSALLWLVLRAAATLWFQALFQGTGPLVG